MRNCSLKKATKTLSCCLAAVNNFWKNLPTFAKGAKYPSPKAKSLQMMQNDSKS
jgi:hypothetical protein